MGVQKTSQITIVGALLKPLNRATLSYVVSTSQVPVELRHRGLAHPQLLEIVALLDALDANERWDIDHLSIQSHTIWRSITHHMAFNHTPYGVQCCAPGTREAGYDTNTMPL